MATLIRRWLPGLLGLTLLAVACDDAIGPKRGLVNVVVQPRFAQQETGAVDGDPASRVDNIRVVIVDAAGDTVVDQRVEWPLDQDTLRVEVALEVTGDQSFDFTLQGREGDTVLFQAQRSLELSADNPNPEPEPAVLEYAGPEASITTIEVTGATAAFLAGAEVALTAVGTTDQGDEVADPLMVWTSLDTLAATVDSTGTVRVKHDGARTARIVGRVAFRTLADTLALPVAPDRFEFNLRPDTITAIGFRQDIRALGLGVDGDTVRNLVVDWTVRTPGVVQYQPDDVGPLAVVFAAAQGETWLVGATGPTRDSVLVVVDQVVTGAAPVPTRAVLGVGDTVALTITSVDAGGTPVPDADPAEWSSSDPAVASVGAATGVVTAQSAPDPFTNGVAVTGAVETVEFPARIEVIDGVNVGPATAVSVGDFHSCRLESIGGRVYCRGVGESGQLGNGSTADQDYAVEAFNPHMTPGDTHTAVTTGGVHTCAVLDTVGGSQAFCWGDNRFGQVGDGTDTNRTQPEPVNTAPVGADLVALTAGGVHTCGLTAAGDAYCWGYDFFGQLGDGSPGGSSVSPTAVTGGHTFTQLTAGWLHTCGLEVDGTVWCWGRGEEGQLGDGANVDTGTPVPASTAETFTRIVAGSAHTCGITAGAELHCWGYNSSGQVGVGSPAFVVATPTAVPFPEAITVTDVALGLIHGCALAGSGAVYCWGGNDQLQLGRATPRVARSPVVAPLSFSPTAISAGGGETCGIAGSRTICWGGIPRDYLGRNVLILPPEADFIEAFSGR